MSVNVRALIGSPKRFGRHQPTADSSKNCDDKLDENEISKATPTHSTQKNIVHKIFSKSTTDLIKKTRKSYEQTAGGASTDGTSRKNMQATPPLKARKAFLSSLRNLLGSGRSKSEKIRGETKCPSQYAQPQAQSLDTNFIAHETSRQCCGGGGDASSDYSSSATPHSNTPFNVSPKHLVHQRSTSSIQRPVQRQISIDSNYQSTNRRRLGSSARRRKNGTSENTYDRTDPKSTTYNDYSLERQASEERVKELRQHSFFQLTVHLKCGTNLVARDTCGTSDPYVKVKVGGKMVFKSRTVYKDLNPTWDETFTVGIEDVFEPIQLKVFDYDWGLQDDFMGLANFDLTNLELNRSQEVTIVLHEPNKFDYMGTITVGLTLVPKTQEEKEQYLQRGGSRIHEQQRRLKSQIWSSVVTIVLVEGKNFPPTSQTGSANPFVKFRLGNEKYKSKVEMKTQNPRWLEQFDLHLFEDQSQLLEINVYEKDPKLKEDFIGRCTLDLREYERENTHPVWVDLEEDEDSNVFHSAKMHLLVTLSGTTSSASISDLIAYKEAPKEVAAIMNRYRWYRTFHNIRDVGLLTVKVFKAQGLAAADFGVNKSDPFCVLELVNARLQTQTEYKTLAPSWNKIFTFDVKDIHSVLEVTVFDEDRDHKVDFLGKVVIPLLKIKNEEKKWYVLKDKKLRSRAKGSNPEILLECSVYWNQFRAAWQTIEPKEEKYMHVENKFKRYVFVKNVNRVKAVGMDIVDIGLFINSCFEWESTSRSVIAFVIFMLSTYYFEAYMAPAALLLIFARHYLVLWILGSKAPHEDFDHADEEVDEEEKDKQARATPDTLHVQPITPAAPTPPQEEKKTIKERLVAIQEVIASVQKYIGLIASFFESILNTFNFTVPYLSWLTIIILIIATVVLYYVPIRALIMFWGINKFGRKLVRPNSLITNELTDFLSRVPDNEAMKDYHELSPLNQNTNEDKNKSKKKKS